MSEGFQKQPYQNNPYVQEAYVRVVCFATFLDEVKREIRNPVR